MYLSSVTSRLNLYDTNSWDLKKTYGCYDGLMRDISWSDDSKYILQVNAKGLIEILSPADHDIRSLQHIPLKDTWSASFHREGHRNIAIGTKSGNVTIWDTKNRTITKTFPSPSQQSSVNFISYNAKNTSLASTLQNGDTVIYGLVSNIPVLNIKLPCSRSISAMKFHHEARSLIGLATYEGHIVLRDITTNKDKVYFENIHASPVTDFTFSLVNKDVMLSCGYDKVMHVYDIRQQNIVSTIRTSYTLTSIAINSENQVALGTKTGHILVYNLQDLTNPYKILKGQEEEVKKVAFQPIRKKTLSTEISLKEDVDMSSPIKIQTPTKKRTSDMFFINETPPNAIGFSVPEVRTDEDSFLVMMGLDKSNIDFDENQSEESKRRSEKYYTRYQQLDAEKNITKTSTPLNSRISENVLPSPCTTNDRVCLNVPICTSNGSNANNLQDMEFIPNNAPPMEPKLDDDLKDYIKMSLFDVAYDNRQYYFRSMMEFTKLKLYLDKQLGHNNKVMQKMMENQTVMMEMIEKLSLQIEQLKNNNNNKYN